ncbi:uncharacterized protein PAC_05553 [Phialocephala subalpina]|uniref:2EXR domain-containing protein n=1 Tax=Phialocephala subalpina TaxID=576137 RepID=A0A1L7WSD4_9HELO|nr:uncharacterized protein PAC_05553 [Phialocephala subalpina]
MATEPSLQKFEQFSRLPDELKCQVWSYASRRRILQVYYDTSMVCWRVCQDSWKPDPVSQVNLRARQGYVSFLDLAVHPQRDNILISDPKFAYRPLQKALLETENMQRLEYISFSGVVWQGLRHTHHSFPTASISPVEILQKFSALKDFTLAIIDEDDVELETSSYGYTGEWTEEKSDEWNGDMIGWDSDEEEQLQQVARKRVAMSRDLLNRLGNEPVEQQQEPEESSELPQAAKAENFLRGLEERQLGMFIEQGYTRRKGILRWQTWDPEGHLGLFEKSLFEDDIRLVFWREKKVNPEWKPPKIHIRELEVGEMPFGDEGDTEWEKSDAEDEEVDLHDYEDDEYDADTNNGTSDDESLVQ